MDRRATTEVEDLREVKKEIGDVVEDVAAVAEEGVEDEEIEDSDYRRNTRRLCRDEYSNGSSGRKEDHAIAANVPNQESSWMRCRQEIAWRVRNRHNCSAASGSLGYTVTSLSKQRGFGMNLRILDHCYKS